MIINLLLNKSSLKFKLQVQRKAKNIPANETRRLAGTNKNAKESNPKWQDRGISLDKKTGT